jgi:ribose 5-phosphate isomerase B
LRRRGHGPLLHGALGPEERDDWAWASEMAEGARKWNDANVLALSLRATSKAVLNEIFDAWFSGEPSGEPDDVANIRHLDEI